jgi:hypothetical protein
MAKAREGHCHICGCYGKLSFEHVPPEAAFNDRPIVLVGIQKILLRGGEWDNPRGTQQQRGAGRRTLCERCNSLTGKWYGAAFADWAHQGMEIARAALGYPTLIYPFNIFPLRLIKQIICMFLSVNSPNFRLAHPDLVKRVLNRDAKFLPPNVRVYAFYALSSRSRSSGVTARADAVGDRMKFRVYSEVTFPPFGFVMAIDSEPPDPRLCDISSFAEYEYRDWYAGMRMRLPIFPIYSAYPGDYRSRDQVLAQAAASREV